MLLNKYGETECPTCGEVNVNKFYFSSHDDVLGCNNCIYWRDAWEEAMESA
jgi:hypothetical protein